ncbi:MAG: hypothetical protein LUQ71_02200 [Methanoregula sp.]|jgi:hypothetical protein|nr:hypothetical protein [Methanoregula sp.]
MTEETCVRKREGCREQMDAIQRFFMRPFFLSCTIGIPFCIFKILFGLSALREGMSGGGYLGVFGMVVTVWAFTDLLMNSSRSALDLLHRPAPFEYCTIAQLGRIFGRPLIFLAFDTLLTFAIICAMLWTGWITTLSPAEAILWYAATTMNLISLSLVSLYNEIRHGNS